MTSRTTYLLIALTCVGWQAVAAPPPDPSKHRADLTKGDPTQARIRALLTPEDKRCVYTRDLLLTPQDKRRIAVRDLLLTPEDRCKIDVRDLNANNKRPTPAATVSETATAARFGTAVTQQENHP